MYPYPNNTVMHMKNIALGQTLFVGDDSGVLVHMGKRDGRIVTVAVSVNGYEATDPEVQGLTTITEGEAFTIEGEQPVYMHMGYDEEEGYPLLQVAPRSMVG